MIDISSFYEKSFTISVPQRPDTPTGSVSEDFTSIAPKPGMNLQIDASSAVREISIQPKTYFGNPTFAAFCINRFIQACQKGSDINHHLPNLLHYALDCPHITEMGTRTGVSTNAWIMSLPARLICYDIANLTELRQELSIVSQHLDFSIHQANTLQLSIEETDLLFIDTLHVYEQVKQELILHSAKVRKFIVLHDTMTCGVRWFSLEGDRKLYQKGIRYAIYEFLKENTAWFIRDEFLYNNGVMVLQRK